MEKISVLQLFFKGFVSTFSNFFGVPVFSGTFAEWFLPECDNCTGQEPPVKICLKDGKVSLFVWVFMGHSFYTTLYFD